MNTNVRIVPDCDQIPERRNPRLPLARIHFDPPNQERVFAIYWRGTSADSLTRWSNILTKNHLLRRYPIRHNYVDGLLKPLPTDTPLPQEWLDEHSEQVEIMTNLNIRILNDLQYTLKGEPLNFTFQLRFKWVKVQKGVE